jgi:CheY-like chemotaxis protein
MNLVGNLEDLGLGEILQIVSLSRKTGILTLNGTKGEGEIVFSQGEVIRAASPEYTEGIAELLVRKGIVDPSTMESACAIQERDGFKERIGAILSSRFKIPAEAIEGVIREQIERMVGSFFGWTAGTFDFELQEHMEMVDANEIDPAQFMLDQGINSQYLAIEGARLLDEKRIHGQDAGSPESGSIYTAQGAARVGSAFNLPDDAAYSPDEVPAEPGKRHIVVLVDDHAATRDVLTVSLEECGYEVFPFAGGADSPLMRLASLQREGMEPTLLLDLLMPKMDGTGIMGGIELLDLISANFSDIPVMAMADRKNEEAEQELSRMGYPLIMKPGEDEIGDPRAVNDFMVALLSGLKGVRKASDTSEECENVNLGDELRQELGEETAGNPPPVVQSTGIALLRGMLEELNDPALEGGITLLVLRFAAEFMNRGVIFTVRRDKIEGLGQFGINAKSGSSDSVVRSMKIPRGEGSLFSGVMECRVSMKVVPDDDQWTRYILENLGGETPAEIFLGPIVSEGKVVAMLYGDNLPENKKIGDTDSLEIFLSQAGVAMEKALLQSKLKGMGVEGK